MIKTGQKGSDHKPIMIDRFSCSFNIYVLLTVES